MTPTLADASRASFSDRLADRVRATQSAVCVGLDPRLDQLPALLQPPADAGPAARADRFREFCFGVIDAVADRVPVVKPQAAFFEQLGPPGMRVLHEVICHAADRGLLVILDGKRNDIGSTAEAYADAYIGRTSVWGSDALTVSPYLGEDSLQPFVVRCDARAGGLFVLVKTSNPGGGLLQDRSTDSQTVYQRVADLVTELNVARIGRSGYGPVGAVVGATYPQQLAELRAKMPTAWILIPGFGAQGGGADDVVGGFDSQGLGAVINSSRHLIFAYRRQAFAEKFGDRRWQEAVAAATDEMNQQLEAAVAIGRG